MRSAAVSPTAARSGGIRITSFTHGSLARTRDMIEQLREHHGLAIGGNRERRHEPFELIPHGGP